MNNNHITGMNVRPLINLENCPALNRQSISFGRKASQLKEDTLSLSGTDQHQGAKPGKKKLINFSTKRQCNFKSIFKLFLALGLTTVGTVMNANRVLPKYGYILTNGGLSTISKDQAAYDNVNAQLAKLEEHPYGKKILEAAKKHGMPEIVVVDSFQFGDYQALQVGNHLVVLKDSPITPGLIAHELIHKITEKDGISLVEEQVVAEIQERIDFDLEDKKKQFYDINYKVGLPEKDQSALQDLPLSSVNPPEIARVQTAGDYNKGFIKKWFLSRDNHIFDTLDQYGLTPMFRTPYVESKKSEADGKRKLTYYIVETPFNEQLKDLPVPESIKELEDHWTLLPARRPKK